MSHDNKFDGEGRGVSDAAAVLGVSVRTLHYWEERGLVVPSARTWANYRVYSDADIARAQRVLIYRATGMALADIARVLDAEGTSLEHLARQRALLMDKRHKLDEMLDALDYLMEEEMKDTNLSVDEIATVLGDAHFAEHHEEAEERYGGSDDWAISQKNAAQRTAEDWADLKSRTDELEVRLAAACGAGTTPESEEARALVEEHRTLLCEHFPVSPAKHVLIASGYTADPRFRAHYDERQAGLAEWLQAAINAAAAAQGVDPDAAVWE